MAARFPSLLLLSFSGLLLNVLLLHWKLADGSVGIAGCGGKGGCHTVLASRWSQVFGLPVPVLGVLVYILLITGLLLRKYSIVALCCGMIIGSAAWFVIVQALLTHRFCPWCTATHGVGILIAGLVWAVRPRAGRFCRGVLAGICAALALALLQLFGPAPATYRVDDKIAAAAGEEALWPSLGSSGAKHVLVEYFDYQCPACRTMGGYLAALIAKHPTQVRVSVLPVPWEHGCNSALTAADIGHRGSCDLTKIALAVWRAKPESFPAVHRAFLADSPPDRSAALAIADRHISPQQLEAAMRDPWIDQLIRANIADWISLSKKTRQMPKLRISRSRILHGLPSNEADFIRVMEKELGL